MTVSLFRFRAVLLIAAAVAAGGCATTQVPQSRTEWQAIHVREFRDKTPDEVLDAAEEVLRLADHDFTFDYPDGQLIATRRWLIYVVLAASMGTDYWKVTAAPLPDGGTRATVEISQQASSVVPSPVFESGGGVGSTVMAMGLPGTPVQHAPPYRLFWRRVENRLGMWPHWTTCDDFGEESGNAGLHVLCSVNTDDRAPE